MPVQIEGTGPVDTPLLLFFNQRAVGGTLSELNGFYSMTLIVGDERSGDYPVEVQVRGTRDIVRELICRVPNGTPSPEGTPGTEGTPNPEATPANLDSPTTTPTLPPRG
jgi:hypothetical protein